MAKQNINVGSSANKGDGDPLRTAFTKINSNFTELYDAIGLGDGSVNLGSLEFSGSTITTTDSSRIEIAQEVRITSDLTMRGSIVPNIDNQFDLGSPDNQWRSLYVSSDTIFIGGVPLAVDNQGNLTVDGSPVSGGGGSTLVNGEFVVGLQVNGSLLLPTGDYQENQSRYQGAIVSENESSAIYMDVQTNSQDNVYGGMRLETWNSVPIDIRTRAGGQGDAIKNWRFDSNGSITFPDSTVQTTAWTGIADYNNLINKPNLAGTYQFSVAADDSTQRVISTDEVIKFIGAGGITTASDAEGNITITGSGGSVSSLVNGAYTVSLGSTGTLTVPANGIITAPIAQEFQLQAKDANSVLRNEINLDPNNGTYMSVWSDQTTSFSFNDWDTGSWNNESGLGAARFTDAQALQDFWTTGPGSLGLAYEASINGGARTPNVFYDNNNGETYGVFLGLDAVPPGGQGTTVPITSLVFYYRLQSKINMDVTGGGEILLDAQSMDLDLRTTLNLDLRANQNLNLRGLGQYPVRIYTDDTTHKWEFDNTGSLTLPPDGKIYGIGAGANPRYGYMSWDGESSGDGSGFNTMRLVPDLQGLEDLDQYIIIDPTGGVPGHIHIRAGGTQDNSLADLYLGGEHSHVKISAGLNPPVTVMANDNSWTFGTDGSLTIPGDIRSEGNINIEINLSDSTLRRWQFGEDGELTLPEDAVVKTTSGHLTIKGQNNVYIDSATNGQIEIGRSSGVGAVSLGSKSRGTNVVVDDLQVANGVYEFFSSLADATGVVTHNCANGHIFYHTSPDANWTVNLTNLLDTWNRATSVTIIIAQGATGYYPSAVQIAGVAQTINWQGNATPTPSTNRTDVVTFSIINNSGTYIVLGQLTGF